MKAYLFSATLIYVTLTAASGQGWLPLGSHFFGNEPISQVADIVEYDGDIYAVGGFNSNLSSTINFVAKYDGSTWSQVGSGFQFAVNRRVEAAAVFNGELYIGGNFVINNGTTTFTNLAKYDLANNKWLPVATTADPVGPIYELEVWNSGAMLFIGGDFTSINALTTHGAMNYNGTQFSTIESGVSTGTPPGEDPDQVYAAKVFGAGVIFGGEFTTAGILGVKHIARWNGGVNKVGNNMVSPGVGNGSSGNKAIWEMAVYNGKLYVGGMFNEFYNSVAATSTTDHLAVWDGMLWGAPAFATTGSPLVRTSAMAVHNNRLYIGSLTQGNVYSLDDTPGTGGWRTEPPADGCGGNCPGARVFYESSDQKLYLGTNANGVYWLADPMPKFTSTANCTGQPVQLTDQSTSRSTITSWSWTFEDANIASSTDQNPTVTFNTGGGHDVTLEVTSAAGTTSYTYVVTTKATSIPAPSQFNVSSPTVCQNQTGVTYTVAAVADATSYNWSYSGDGATIGTSTASTAISFGANATSGTLSVAATNGCVVGTAITLPITVNAAPVITQQPPVSTGLCAGTDLVLAMTATGSSLTYKWQYYLGSSAFADLTDGANAAATFKLGGTYSGVSTNTLTLTGATPNTASATDPAAYRLVVTGAGGCVVNSSTKIVNLYSAPTVATHPSDVTKCAGSAGNVIFTTAITTPGLGGVTYQWQVDNGSGFTNITNNTLYSNATTAELTLATTGITAALHNNKYRCVVGACSPPVNSFHATLLIDTPPTVTTPPAPLTVCSGLNAEFSVVTSGTVTGYQWMEQLPGNAFLAITDNSLYSGATTATLTLTNVPASKHQARYLVKLSNGTCTNINSQNAQLLVSTLPTITSQPAVGKNLCEGGNTTFNVSASAVTVYQWQVDFTGLGYTNVADGGVYSGATGAILAITGATSSLSGNKYRCRVGSCEPYVYSDPGVLTVYQTPLISVQPVDQTACAFGSATFSVTAVGSNLAYQWLQNGSTINGADTNELTLPNLSTGNNGVMYSCRITGANGCTIVTSTEAKLTVNQVLISTQPVAVDAFCAGGNATFTVAASTASPTYKWQEDRGSGFADIADGGVYGGATTASLVLTAATASMNNFKYRCVVGGLCPAVNSNTVILAVNQIPAKPVITVTGMPDAPVLSTSTTVFSWYRNGIGVGSSQSHTVTEEGSYTVKTVFNTCQSVLSDAFVILITDANGPFERAARLFPNPASTRLMISLRSFRQDIPVTINVVDLLGRNLESRSITDRDEVELDIESYPAGNYAVILRQDAISLTERFVKKH